VDNLDWNHLYLLGWYDRDGRSNLTTWHGDYPMLTVVVTGVNGLTLPLWDAPVPPNARFEVTADLEGALAKARSEGGYAAIGWYIEEGFERKAKLAGFSSG
jgi:hypothetical protein